MGFQKTLILAVALSASPSTAKVDRLEELYCLANNIYFESRNQPKLGQIAVGQVTMNRVNSPKFPNTVCGVVNRVVKRETDANLVGTVMENQMNTRVEQPGTKVST